MPTHFKYSERPKRQYSSGKRLRIGDLLRQKGLISNAQLLAALAQKSQTYQRLGEVLIERGYISRFTLQRVLWEQSLRKTIATSILLFGTTITHMPDLAHAQHLDHGRCEQTTDVQTRDNNTTALAGTTPTFPRFGWISIHQGRIRPELRQFPRNSNSRILDHLRPGNVVTLLGMTGDRQWYQVMVDSTCGYITASQIELLEPGAEEASSVELVSLVSLQTPLTGFSHPLGGLGYLSQGSNDVTHTGRAMYALDFAVEMGTSVYAMRSGRVVRLEERFPDSGGGSERLQQTNYVWLEHEDGVYSAYVHLQQGFNQHVGLEIGDRVEAGQLIGLSGNSGWSTAPHLHIEVHEEDGGTFGRTLPFVIDRLVAVDRSLLQEWSVLVEGHR